MIIVSKNPLLGIVQVTLENGEMEIVPSSIFNRVCAVFAGYAKIEGIDPDDIELLSKDTYTMQPEAWEFLRTREIL